MQRRNFLKCAALTGAALLPVHYAAGQETPGQTPPKQPDPLFEIKHDRDIRPKKQSPRKITIPNVGDYKVLKGDFHIHTLFSDGLVMPRDRILEAVDNGLDAIAMTDHIEHRPFLGGGSTGLHVKLEGNLNGDHNIAYNLGKSEAEKNNIILVRGAEITKRKVPPGHLNTLFLQDINPVAEAADDWKKMVEIAAAQGGYILWNHPGWISPANGGLAKGVPMSFTAEHEDVRKKGWLHGIEVFNGFDHYPIVSDWCNEKELGYAANTDIHQSDWHTYGAQNLQRPMTLVLAEDRTEAALREAFFARRTLGWAAGMIFGHPQWVEKLFAACVTVTTSAGTVQLKNKSDIPCKIDSDGAAFDLKPMGEVSFACKSKWTVTNWYVGTFKGLEFRMG